MKKLLLLILFAFTGTFAQTDVVKFKGKIANRNSDAITLTGPDFKRTIPVDKDGKFSDSFSAPTALYQFYDGAEFTELFLKNGFDLTLTMDAQQFDESIVYEGKGAKENNILAKKTLDEEALEPKIMAVQSDQQAVMKLVQEFTSSFEKQITASGIDPELKLAVEAQKKMQQEQMKERQKEMLAQKEQTALLVGKASPQFDYENHKGGKTKLADLKGKYVYIDNWATWCGPCRAEIPHLQKVEEKYHGKNIEFVSISIDEKKDYEKWKQFVTDKQLGGIQLYADNAWKSQFIQDFGINSIPRFILIGPDGKVIDADAKRPSDPALVAQLDALLK